MKEARKVVWEDSITTLVCPSGIELEIVRRSDGKYEFLSPDDGRSL